MSDDALNYKNEIKISAKSVEDTIQKLDRQNFQYATTGDVRRLVGEIARLKALHEWRDIKLAPKCDLCPTDSRANEEAQFVLVSDGKYVIQAYYQIDDMEPSGGYWMFWDDGIYPEPTKYCLMPAPPTEGEGS